MNRERTLICPLTKLNFIYHVLNIQIEPDLQDGFTLLHAVIFTTHNFLVVNGVNNLILQLAEADLTYYYTFET